MDNPIIQRFRIKKERSKESELILIIFQNPFCKKVMPSFTIVA